MDASLPSFVAFKHFSFLRKFVLSFPGWLTKMTAPALAGLVDLQELLGAQVKDIVNNPQLLELAPHPIIYHRLLDPEANKGGSVPDAQSLYEEAQALLFGGADSVGNTVSIGTYHILQKPEMVTRLKEEMRNVWPDLQKQPKLEELEKLPFLTAVIKESLRLAPGVPAPLPRIVPSTGASIGGRQIPPGTIVGMAQLMVHLHPHIFPSPEEFDPERWLGEDSSFLDKWFVPFSRGPRACLGQTLAMCELYIAFGGLFRRFDIQLDGTTAENFVWRECFLPHFNSNHMRSFCKPVES
jgi:cytochrome P450